MKSDFTVYKLLTQQYTWQDLHLLLGKYENSGKTSVMNTWNDFENVATILARENWTKFFYIDVSKKFIQLQLQNLLALLRFINCMQIVSKL